MPKVLAVIVTFNSQSDVLLRLLRALAPQVGGGVVINNSAALSVPEPALALLGFELIQMPANVGVASALNAGFEWAQRNGADFVISFDQDSEPASDMLQRLMGAYTTLCAEGRKVGAIGPQQVDSRTGQLSPFIAPISLLRHKVIPAKGKCLAVDHLITSGCLVPMHVWTMVGRFLDELFIDYVDIEWSLRLRHHGLCLYGVRDAVMQHAMGDGVAQRFGRAILLHSPLRHYYIFRNGAYLQKLAYIPLGWKIADTVQLVKKAILFTVTATQPKLHLMAVWCGLRDAYLRRMGPHGHSR